MQTELNNEIAKRAFQTGKIIGSLKSVQTELHMGNSKEALASLNELIKYIESEIVPEFYGKGDIENERPESNERRPDMQTEKKVCLGDGYQSNEH